MRQKRQGKNEKRITKAPITSKKEQKETLESFTVRKKVVHTD